MLVKSIAVAALVLAGVSAASAQQRGTFELGGFGSNSSFHNSFGMNGGFGGGARFGHFIFPRLSVEVEGGGTSSDRPDKIREMNVSVIAARLTAVPIQAGRLSLLIGAGMDRSDTWVRDGYGVQGLLGAKLALLENVALRVDGIQSFMVDGAGRNASLHVGLSVYRSPSNRTITNTVTNTVTRDVPGPVQFVTQVDAAAEAELRRLRALEASYLNLRDSLGRIREVPIASPQAMATLRDMVYFANDRSDLDPAAKAILTAKLPVFRDNPGVRISITGFASQPGTPEHNMALGLRRAEAAKAYLVAQGISASRIEIATQGEGQLVVDGPGEVADAQNRRGVFQILVAVPN
jgi:outer membrane protein OmpA-like peptidoglycan-associated protein